ncbi:hypothetical protein GCM10009647_052250 [Streptomyces sanglieri]
MEFEVVQGDITEQQADALVNAANTGLQMGGGVAGALREIAGPDIQKEANEESPIGLGEAVETGAYGLDATYVIHAATMELGGGADESTIRNSTRNALATADDLGCESIVLPALGCGIAGVDLEEGAYYIFEEVLDAEPETLEDVQIIGYRDKSYDTMQRIADNARYDHYWGDKEWRDTMWQDSVLQFGLPATIHSKDGDTVDTEVLLSEDIMRIDSELSAQEGDVVEYQTDGSAS